MNLKDKVKYNVSFVDKNTCESQFNKDVQMNRAFKAINRQVLLRKQGNILVVAGKESEAKVNFVVTFKPMDLPEDILDIEAKSVSITRTACLGHCPTYELSIYENGVLDFNGRKFTKARGIQLLKEDLNICNELFAYLDQMDFKEINTTKNDDLTEESIITIQYQGKKMIFRENDEIDTDGERLYETLVSFLTRNDLIF